jgi:TfoX/Sxy family transcriptional regulator of competence genes
MAYDQDLAQRIKKTLAPLPGLEEKKMFGGVCFLIRGNMACGVHGSDLIVRVGLERYPEALRKPHVKLFDITGRPMKGWIMVASGGVTSESDLKGWVEQGVEFTATLPPK